MADCLESPSITVTEDIISTAIVDTIYNETLTNRIDDLPRQRRKRIPPPTPPQIPPITPPIKPPLTPPTQTVIELSDCVYYRYDNAYM